LPHKESEQQCRECRAERRRAARARERRHLADDGRRVNPRGAATVEGGRAANRPSSVVMIANIGANIARRP
jgi:hypothetical protein